MAERTLAARIVHHDAFLLKSKPSVRESALHRLGGAEPVSSVAIRN
jgi:hypothetical protein